MADAYIKDPRTIAKPGDVVRVKVLEVDPKTPPDLADAAAR
jgi:ribosomal protein S1